MFEKHLFQPARSISLGSNETIKQAVMAGMGISLLSMHTLPLELKTGGVCILDVIGTPIDRTWYVVHMSSKRLLPAGQQFRQFLMEHTAPSLLRDYRQYTHRNTTGKNGGKAKIQPIADNP